MDVSITAPPPPTEGELEERERLKDLFNQGSSVSGRAMVEEKIVTSGGGIDWNELAVLNSYKDPQDMLADLYVRRDHSIYEIAIMLKISPTSVRLQLAKVHITTRPRGGKRNVKGIRAVEAALHEAGDSMENLLHRHETAYQLAKHLNVPPHRVYSYLRVKGIPLPTAVLNRPPKEAIDDVEG